MAVLLAVGLVTGCGASRETVTVTERPEPIASTEGSTQVATPPEVPIPTGYDTVQARRFDQGKMWTFENPPARYFRQQYGFKPSSSWFNRARLAALRFGDGCSASFVSGSGLVMTNHHCGRDYIEDVSRSGESLLEDGFYARSTGDERRVEGLHVDQLIRIEDVTDRVYRGTGDDPDARGQARQERADRLEERLTQEAKSKNERLRVEVVGLYSGAKYSAYTYRRYEDVRLVMAPELRLGFFGGAADNFTYPRYALDVAFFRVYDSDGEPLKTDSYFEWDTDGAEEGDPVFVVGNPGSTRRLSTISQLEFARDHELPARLDVLERRAEILEPYVENHPERADEYGLRNVLFTVENSVKNLRGQLRGLRDPYLMARRGKAERALRDSIVAVDSLRRRYASVFDQIEQLQQSKRTIAGKSGAFTAFSNVDLGSRVLTRAVYAYYYDFLRTRGAPEDRLENIREDAVKVEDWPAEVEKEFIEARLREIRSAYGPSHPTVQRLLGDRSPAALADSLVAQSALMDSTAYIKKLGEGYLSSKDASVPVMKALAPLFLNANRQMSDFNSSEQTLNAKLSRARFAVYGNTIPPDATFTLRIADGRVKGYPYNGTTAPAFTNFYGLYDHYFSYNSQAWSLPEEWVDPPEKLDLDTPINLVTTNDITGGNSGSPLLNRELEVVGLIFDGNIESLPNEFLYTSSTARAVAVDARGILEALDDVFQTDRLAQELTTGRLVATEDEANDSVTSDR
jgi:hypothetical protein